MEPRDIPDIPLHLRKKNPLEQKFKDAGYKDVQSEQHGELYVFVRWDGWKSREELSKELQRIKDLAGKEPRLARVSADYESNSGHERVWSYVQAYIK